MKKLLDFLKSNILVAKWTVGYFFVIWLILRFIFNFDMFDARYWWKFFHATLHGFGGLVFGALVYAMIPIYIASVLIIYRKKQMIIQFPSFKKIFDWFSKLKPEKQPEPTQEEEKPKQEEPEPEQFPADLPHELRVPFMRAKNNLSLTGAMSVYNKPKQKITPNTPQQIMENATDNIPLPNDFDIPNDFVPNNFVPNDFVPNDFDTSNNFEFNDSKIPTFTDINFDEPVKDKFENDTTKYFESKNTEFETYKNFVATDKYLIYEHSDTDFWIMDEEVWFAAGQQKNSPTSELIDIAKQNGLTPVIYLKSQNIMDIETTIAQFESMGIRVIKSLDELN